MQAKKTDNSSQRYSRVGHLARRFTRDFRVLERELASTTEALREQRAVNEQLAAGTGQVGAVLDALPQALLVLTPQRIVSSANSAARSLLGDAIIGLRWPEIAHECNGEYAFDGGSVVILDDSDKRDQRLRALGETEVSVLHQMRSPLTVAGLHIERLLDTTEHPAALIRLHKVQRTLQAIEQTMSNSLIFVRGELQSSKRFRLHALIEELKAAWSPLLEGARCEWPRDVPDGLYVDGDAGALVSAFTNVLENALRVSHPLHFTVGVCAGHVGPEDGAESVRDGFVRITLTDNGPGMSERLLQRLRGVLAPEKERCASKPSGRGLGLKILVAVVHAHGGSVDIDSEPGFGTSIGIDLPLAEAARDEQLSGDTP